MERNAVSIYVFTTFAYIVCIVGAIRVVATVIKYTYPGPASYSKRLFVLLR